MPTHYGSQLGGQQEEEQYGYTSAEPIWNPSYTSEQVKEYIDAYKVNPRQFEPDFLRNVNRHAAHYKIPFAYNEEDNKASVGSLISNLGSGFVEGFTTLRIDKEQPKNEWDSIAKNIGHLAGFVGFLPATPFKVLGFKRLADAARSLKGKSVPMLVATAATKKAKKLTRSMTAGARDARVAAGQDAMGLFGKAPIVKDVVEGAFHLGVASSVSTWQGGVDEMMHGLIGGAKTGAMFRGIGNLIKGFGPQGDKAVRGLVSSLYTGLPSTMQGQTTPEQVYQYLLGAYFGINEMPYHQRQGEMFHRKWAFGDKKHPEGWQGKRFDEVPGWEKLDSVTKRYVEEVAHPRWQKTVSQFYQGELLKRLGIVDAEGKPILSKEAVEARRIAKEELEDKAYRETEELTEAEITRVKTAMEEGTVERRGDDITSSQLETPVLTRIKRFVEVDMQDSWVGSKKPAEQQLLMQLEIQKKWSELEKKAKSTQENPEKEMREWLAKEYKIDVEAENVFNFWRGFGNRILKERPVSMYTAEIGSDGTLTVRSLSYGEPNKAGKDKMLMQQPHIIQKIYEDAYREVHPDRPFRSKFEPEVEGGAPTEPAEYKWARSASAEEKYEVSTVGDKRFSALNARLEDGRTIEEHYQVDVKGYRSIKEGKGKPPKDTNVNLYREYKKLWDRWAKQNPDLIKDLAGKAANKTLTDKFASTDVSQARALSEILNTRLTEGRPFVTMETLKKTGVFEAEGVSMPVVIVKNIPSGKDKPVLMRNTGKEILVAENLLDKKFKEKAWTKSTTQADGTKSEPLAKDIFKTKEELLNFSLLHEIQHSITKKRSDETIGQYETRINNKALQSLAELATPTAGMAKIEPDLKTELTTYAKDLKENTKGIKDIYVIGSVAEKGKGKDIDILYDMGKIKIPEHILKAEMEGESELAEYISENISPNFNSIKYDNFVKIIDQNNNTHYYYSGQIAQTMELPKILTNLTKLKGLEKNKISLLEEAPAELATPPVTGVARHAEVILDHTVISEKVSDPETGRSKEISREISLRDLPEYYRNKLSKEKEWAFLDADQKIVAVKSAVNDHHGKVFYKMSKKGYYYYGGRGDAHRQIFVKKHPILENVKKDKIDSYVKELMDVMPKSYKKDYESELDAFEGIYGGSMFELVKGEYVSKAREVFAKDWLSNLLYMHSLNFGTPPKTVKEAISAAKNLRNKKDVDGKTINSYIKNPSDFNKRMQIWFTSGISVDSKFIRELKDPTTGDLVIPDLNEGNFNIMLSAGPERFNQENLTNKSEAKFYNEVEDGAIYVRSDVLKAILKDSGLPSDAGFEKSFIASPDPVYGALTGKYGMFKVREGLDKWMKGNNVHIIVNALSAKQKGSRDYVLWDWNSKTQNVDIKKYNEISKKAGESVSVKDILYQLNPSDMRAIPSVYASKKNLDNQQIHKQIFTNLTPFAHSPIKAQEIVDMYAGLVSRRIKGVSEANKRLDKFLSDPVANKDMIEGLVKDLRSLGINELLNAMKSNNPNVQEFIARAYMHMFRIEPSVRNSLKGEGERDVADTYLENMVSSENKGVYERIMRITDSDLSGVLHKWSTRVRGSVVRNFFVDEITRPIAYNSISGPIRPFDPVMRKEGFTSNLNKRDDVFFLDNNYKNKKVLLDSGKSVTLESLWNTVLSESKTGKRTPYGKQAENILTSLVVRTPMDSISGGHSLKFGGFTGVEGYGVLIHPRVMKALGGADIDGDKVQVYFGGETHGMKRAWQDMYKRNKDEYLNEITNKIEDSKPSDLEQEFGSQSVWIKDRLENENLVLSPLARRHASETAAEGRDLLGPIVVNRAVASATHAAIATLPERIEEVPITTPLDTIVQKVRVPAGHYLYEVKANAGVNEKGEIIWDSQWLLARARTSDKSLRNFRRTARALMGFASDPMDIAGLRERPYLIKKMKESLLEVQAVEIKGVDKGVQKIVELNRPPAGEISDSDLYAPTKLFANINSTLYGKNIAQNRRYYAYEIQKAQADLFNPNRKVYDRDLKRGLYQPGMPKAESNTFLSLVARDMQNVDFSESIFRRIKRKDTEKDGDGLERFVTDLYTKFNESAKPDKELWWLKEILGSDGLWVPRGNVIENVIKKKLYEKSGYEKELNPKTWTENLMDHMFNKHGNYKEEKLIPEQRKHWLNQYIKTAEDYFVNDLSDMTSIPFINKYAKQVGHRGLINSIWKQTEKFKLQAAINEGREPVEKTFGGRDALAANQQSVKDLGRSGKVTSRNQLTIDMIEYRASLEGNAERKLFDHFMIGTLNRKEVHKQTALEEGVNKGSLTDEQGFNSKENIQTAFKTTLSKLGFSSDAVSDASIREYFREYKKVFASKDDILVPKEVETAKNYAETVEESRLITTDKGLSVEGSHLNSNSRSAESNKYIDEIAPFEGIKLGTATKKEREVITNIVNHIDHYFGDQPIVGKYFNQIVRGVLRKDVNAMTSKDLMVLDNYFKSIRDKGFIEKVLDFFSKSKADQLPKRIYYNFPEGNNKLLMRHDINFIQSEGLFKDKRGNPIMGTIQRPTQIVNEIRDFNGDAQQIILKQQDEYRVAIEKELDHIFVLGDGYKIYEMAGRMMESYGKVRTEDNLIDVPLTGIVKSWIKHTRDSGKVVTSSEEHFLHNVYSEALKRSVKETDWHKIKNKDYVYRGKRVKGFELAERIVNKLTSENEKIHKWHVGVEKISNIYLQKVNEVIDIGSGLPVGKKGMSVGDIKGVIDKIPAGTFNKNVDSFLREIGKTRLKFLKDARNNKIPLELGMDNLNLIVKYMQLHQMYPAIIKSAETVREGKLDFFARVIEAKMNKSVTGQFGFNEYFPHISWERKLAAEGLRKYIDSVSKDTDLNKEDKRRMLQKAILRHRQLDGDFVAGTELKDSWRDVAEVLHGLAQDKKSIMTEGFKKYNQNKKVSSQFKRFAHTEGWMVNPEAYQLYAKNIINTFHQQVADIASKDAIHQFRIRPNKLGKELTDLWSNFLYLYSEQAGGAPTNIPKYLLENPKMNIKGTAYAWFADNAVAHRLNKARELLGIRDKKLKLSGIPITGSLTAEDIKTLKDVDFNTLRKLGQMEAKYQLATLLAHPKSTIANLYGGSVHTLISTGWEHYKNAKSIKYLRLHVNKNWKSMEDVNDWVRSLGIIEEFLIYEANINPSIKSANMQRAVKDAIRAIKKDPNLPDKNLYNIAKKYGITESAFNKAASFMRLPERYLRRDAFMAHYLQAREKFGNLTPDYNNATLVEMAKKGVKATQFLYSAPYRPAFANSQLGKVMTRFQIWAWNSVRFRRQILEEASIHGFREGTQEFEKFKRLAIADMFMLGLSNIFMYSIFENALPAPWNWFQDTADMMFGDDKQRERAFFGAYPYPLQPLQVITPPALRLLPPMFKAMVTDDYSRLSDYYIWTMFPFGRLMRDVAGPGGIIENPMRTVEKTTGLPYMQFGSYFKALQEQERLKPGG